MKRVKVILKQDVYNLGEEGDVREVAAGYARNFLIPQGLALGYSKQNVAYFEQRKEV
ncbi:MAG: 50S ribosomal protein L9, partial [Spirochaetales bacterium]|nr:50S ribosomal protein L9 [Spirochaetales bacterium]